MCFGALVIRQPPPPGPPEMSNKHLVSNNNGPGDKGKGPLQMSLPCFVLHLFVDLASISSCFQVLSCSIIRDRRAAFFFHPETKFSSYWIRHFLNLIALNKLSIAAKLTLVKPSAKFWSPLIHKCWTPTPDDRSFNERISRAVRFSVKCNPLLSMRVTASNNDLQSVRR